MQELPSTTQRLKPLESKRPRVYLDQMFSSDVAQALREPGYDVVRAIETGQARADDEEILEKAISQDRVLVTLDEHFGDWVILPLNRHPGVIRLKVNPATTDNVLRLLLPFLNLHSPDQLRNHLVILSEKRAKWILTG
jgi:predicted nuclease of predicted toxin-antitoxin system